MPSPPAISRLLLGSALACCLPACVTLPWKKDAPAEETPAAVAPALPPMQLPVGTIHHIDTAGKFVLIRSTRFLQIEPGTALSVVDDQGVTVARLEVSPARKGRFLTADIASGVPLAGQHTIMAYTASTANAPAAGLESSGADDIQVLE
ncbi:MAG: hypothetical protein GXX91_08545 [Verrucomicrobiaceae bacterium]|nr:hypothetical protein [Verrucomicrobiaceae bacterium]